MLDPTAVATLRRRAEAHLAGHKERLRRGETDEVSWWAEVVLLLTENVVCVKCGEKIEVSGNGAGK